MVTPPKSTCPAPSVQNCGAIFTQDKLRLKTFCDQQNLLAPGSTIIIGLSGGPDSVFLTYFLCSLREEKKLNLLAAHLNHGWRVEAEQDVLFCQELAKKLEIPFFSAHADQLATHIKYNGSKEEVGRNMRRHFFAQLAREHTANAIALAHHADDQQETFFIRLMRGATLTGLTGIKPRDDLYIRPLLEIHKEEILAWLHANNITYVTDASNNSPTFLRNRIRADVLPALHKSDARFAQNFKSTLNKLQETEEFLIALTHQIFNEISSDEGNNINLQIWRTLQPFLQQRVILYWLCQEKVAFSVSEAFIKEIFRFLHSSRGGEHVLNSDWSIVKKGQQAHIKRLL